MTPYIQTTDSLSLSGTVKVVLDDLSPRPGDTLQIVPILSLGGASLSTVSVNDIDFDLPDLDNGMVWDTSQFQTTGQISVTGGSSSLLQSRPLNYPNPFYLNSGTNIVYFLNDDADIQLQVYSAAGHLVYMDDYQSGFTGGSAGNNEVPISRSIVGDYWPSGVYYYLLLKDGNVVGKGKLAVLPE
jgi:hypothetical protein